MMVEWCYVLIDTAAAEHCIGRKEPITFLSPLYLLARSLYDQPKKQADILLQTGTASEHQFVRAGNIELNV